MLSSNITILPAILPLIASALIMLLRKEKFVFWLAFFTCLGVFSLCLTDFINLYFFNPTKSYAIGGWQPPIGIEYKTDILSGIMRLLVSFVFLALMPMSLNVLRKEIPEKSIVPCFSLMMLLLGGLIGIASTNDIFNLFVFLEISSLATYPLLSFGKSKKALVCAFEYLIIGTIGASFILIGIGFLYFVTGSLNITDISEKIAYAPDRRPVSAGLSFLLLGVFIKAAIFPLHSWLLRGYYYTIPFFAALLAGTATKIALYAGIRIVYSLFGVKNAFQILPLDLIFILFGSVNLLFAAASALKESEPAKILALSSLANIGLILIMLGFDTESGLASAIIIICTHSVSKTLCFAGYGYASTSGKKPSLTQVALLIGLLSLMGIPSLAGFIGKFHAITTIISISSWGLAALIIASFSMLLVAEWRVIESSVLNRQKTVESSFAVMLSLTILASACIWMGINGAGIVKAAFAASYQLYGAVR